MQILYQDKHILVINKPSGLLSQPGSLDDSVTTELEKTFEFLGVVHRLDQATSGIMILALNPKALSHLAKQFQFRTTFKVYEAQVFGRLAADMGHIDLPLRCDWPNRPRQEVHTEGKASLTHWQCIDRNQSTSRVILIPHTGRSHQLRVHLASMGHPIIGDYFYAHETALNMSERLHLHAKELTINHPITNQRLHFFSEAPF
ncbi:bifunctional tRNA pseudouridine(32) synthase/23S rRNA pseudouridine(746) synthase RluA [Oceaniserpentilla sp. 4NH20-0058]|uniref:RluA family pseudouridine synthase n=1 Tax=Oceaniserpentilla sp. 4NH20-0058 TaxID=3127660 RepID=UPI0031088266